MTEVLEKIKLALENAGGPLTVDELAEAVDLLPPAIIKATRLLISQGEIMEIEEGIFAYGSYTPAAEDQQGQSPPLPPASEVLYPTEEEAASGAPAAHEPIQVETSELPAAEEDIFAEATNAVLGCPRCGGTHLIEVTNNACAKRGTFVFANGDVDYTNDTPPEVLREIKLKGYTCEVCKARLKYSGGQLVMYGEDPLNEMKIFGYIRADDQNGFADAALGICNAINMNPEKVRVTYVIAEGVPGFLLADRLVTPDVGNELFLRYLTQR